MREPRIFGIRFRTFAVLFHPQTSQVIIVFSFFYQLCFKAILGSIETECLKIHIEPVETVSFDILILHPEINFAIVISCKVYQEAAVFVLEKIAQVARIH